MLRQNDRIRSDYQFIGHLISKPRRKVFFQFSLDKLLNLFELNDFFGLELDRLLADVQVRQRLVAEHQGPVELGPEKTNKNIEINIGNKLTNPENISLEFLKVFLKNKK